MPKLAGTQYVPNCLSPAADAFGAMLPAVLRVVRYAFRWQRAGQRQDLIAAAIASAFVKFNRLIHQGRSTEAHPTVLAWLAVRQVCDGRRVGARRSSKDVLSDYAQRRVGFRVVGLESSTPGTRGWEPLVLEDKHASPADTAAFRIDFHDWLERLRPRLRAVALVLAEGNTPLETARRFGVSKARISQLRNELRASWDAFQDEPLAA
jgi:hypothetical protein